MKGRSSLLILCAALACAAPVSAQQPPPPTPQDPDNSAVIQELEVVARHAGPAMWTVTRGGGQVTVLGSLSPLPHMLEWNTNRLERMLDGAEVVLAPPTGRVNAFDALNILFHAGDARLPGGRTLWDEVTPEQRARFENLLGQIKGKPDRYLHLKPAIAGFLLMSDFRRGAGLAEAKPTSTVERIAKAKGVKVRTIGQVKLAGLYRAVTHMDPVAERACFDAALVQTERDASQGRILADAWANHDLKALRAGYRPTLLDKCFTELPTLQAAIERGEQEAVAAIQEVLNHGGKGVAVIDLTLLQRKDGVLDRLRAAGAEITIPSD